MPATTVVVYEREGQWARGLRLALAQLPVFLVEARIPSDVTRALLANTPFPVGVVEAAGQSWLEIVAQLRRQQAATVVLGILDEAATEEVWRRGVTAVCTGEAPWLVENMVVACVRQAQQRQSRCG